MGFVVGDEVFANTLNRKGTIVDQRERVGEEGVIEYRVQFEKYLNQWLVESQITHVYEFNNEFEQSLRDLLIDINLLHNPTELQIVRDLYNQKFDLLKGK
ncbi:hypothetical protein NSS71_07925 [Niallia sp. FSL W8-0951]|uniref:hypothetical protein n=1 Tax=Niallia sp. FSL W8-0951 TaxID=2954639 RepID=UPI0030F4F8C9